MPRPLAGSAAGLLLSTALVAGAVAGGGSTAVAAPPSDLPAGVPAAALYDDPSLPTPAGWPFGEQFPHTSGTGRVAGGADLWADFVYDDHGASSATGLPTALDNNLRSNLAPAQGVYSYADQEAHHNGADIARSAVGLDADASYWRVDWNTLTDATVPLAVWALDTDADPSTGVSTWPGAAGVTSPGSDRFLVVGGTGALLTDGAGAVLTAFDTTTDLDSDSFVVRVPRAVLPVDGTWTVRLAAGLADSAGTGFAGPEAPAGTDTTARVYNMGYRSVQDEPPVVTDAQTTALVTAAGGVLASGPLAGAGLDGQTRLITGNFWNEDVQADALASGGDVTAFSRELDWAALATGGTEAEPLPTGSSVRWYRSALDLGDGADDDDTGNGAGDLRPNYLGRTQPYTVYVPTTYDPSDPAPVTLLLHSLGVNHNQYAAYNPLLLQQLCEDRGSICLSTEGYGPDMWYFDEAEVDVWRAWHAAAEAYSLDTERTVVSGYSMGGWAAYKLGTAHPDLFAAAMSLEGPPACGIEAFSGARAPAGDGHCTDDGDSTPVLDSVRWVPYVISQGAIDQLVPVTSGLAQADELRTLGYRYHLELFPAEDHLLYATQDRFGSLVDALGVPTRVVDPGQVDYAWYPDVDVPSLGIGATTAYWLSDLQASDTGPGTVAQLRAVSRAIPDPAITTMLTPGLSTADPTPAAVLDLTWALGETPAAVDALDLTLTGVEALTVDGQRAELACPTVTVDSEGPATITLTGLTSDSVLTGGTSPATITDGVAELAVPAGTTTVTCAAAGSTPTGATPTGATPTGSTPTGSTPIGSTPIGSTPIGSTPIVPTTTTDAAPTVSTAGATTGLAATGASAVTGGLGAVLALLVLTAVRRRRTAR